MKVIKSTPDKLVLYGNNWLILLIISICGLFGLPLRGLSLQVHSLTCNRTKRSQDLCEFSHFAIYEISSRKISPNELKTAIVKVSKDNDPESKTTSKLAVLTTQGEEIYMRRYFDNFDDRGKQEMAARIDNFLHDPKQLNLSVWQYPDLWTTLFSILWNTGCWLGVFASSQVTIFTFDRSIDRLKIREQYLFFRKERKYCLCQISNVVIEKSWNSNGTIAIVRLKLPAGEQIDVCQENTEFIADLIRKFLKIPEYNDRLMWRIYNARQSFISQSNL
jgi:hypothetical protein